MEQVIIREMISTDLNAVTRIYEEVFNPTYISFSELAEGKAVGFALPSPEAGTIFRKQLIGRLYTSSSGLFVACSENNIVGFALASLHTTEAGHIECWLDDIGVSHIYRCQGIAKMLAKQVQDWGNQNGAKYYLLESGIQNETAHRLFEQLGFHPLAIVFCKNSLS
ncbi:GNAT family N-acetyltransferase [Nostoc muscorum FACHB-395]|nr:GNAT family N-acetyltransferase [Desmonostoc muscorum FACHB-395]